MWTRTLLFTSALTFASLVANAVSVASEKVEGNAYRNTVLVANKAEFKPQILEPRLINAWGIATRPAGAGGHFWVTGADTSFEYVGDVANSPTESLRKLHVDDYAYMTAPLGKHGEFATGTAFSGSTKNFVITQNVKGAEPITAPAKFLFSSDGGVISAWTERKKEDGSFDRAPEAITVIDESKQGAKFFGITVNADYSRIYAADFGMEPAINVYDGAFKKEGLTFDQPFDDNKNGKVDVGEYAPFNVQALTTPAGEKRVYVTYAMTQACPADAAKAKQCKEGGIFAGEEDTSREGLGRIAEFDENGKLIKVWQDGGKLSAPWGVAYAPAGFGALANTLLVGNFGDGKIVAFDPATQAVKDMLRDEKGEPVVIDKLWGLIFGNGASLGDVNALYYAAGPNDEKDGVFGSLRLQ